MAKKIDADYSQRFLLPPSLEDWISADHSARFIHMFVDSLQLRGPGFRELESEEGLPNHSNELLLKIWLYGNFHKFRSNRELVNKDILSKRKMTIEPVFGWIKHNLGFRRR